MGSQTKKGRGGGSSKPAKTVQNTYFPKSIHNKNAAGPHFFRFDAYGLGDEELNSIVQEFAHKKLTFQSMKNNAGLHFFFQSNQFTDRALSYIKNLLVYLNGGQSHKFFIKEMNLSENNITGGCLHLILNEKIFSYDELNLSWNNLSSKGLQSISHFLADGGKIKTLNLNKNEIGNDPGALSYLCRNALINKSCSVEALLLSDNNINSVYSVFTPREIIMPLEDRIDDVMCLCAVLYHNNFITHLDLSNNNLGNTGCGLISRCLSSKSTLQKLNLANNKIGVVGFRMIAESISNNTTLTDIDLSFNIDHKDVASLFSDTKLNITDYDECLFAISKMLMKNKTLKTLSLKLSQSRDDYLKNRKVFLENDDQIQWGMVWLFNGLKRNQTLQNLTIDRNYLLPHSENKLLKTLLYSCTGIQSLSFDSLSLDDSSIRDRILEVMTPRRRSAPHHLQEVPPTKNFLDVIPDDILLQILTFLSPKWLMRMRLVQSQFKSMISSQSLWQQVSKLYFILNQNRDNNIFSHLWVQSDAYMLQYDEFLSDGNNSLQPIIVNDLVISMVKNGRRNRLCFHSKKHGVVAVYDLSTQIHEVKDIPRAGDLNEIFEIDRHVDHRKVRYSEKQWRRAWITLIETYRWKRTTTGNGLLQIVVRRIK